MPSLYAFSEQAFSATRAISIVPPALTRLAQSLTADPIVFLEVSARSNTVTVQQNSVAAFSALPFSATGFARTQRNTQTFLFATRPWTGLPTDGIRPNERAIPQLISGGRVSRRVPVDSSIARRGQRTIGDAVLANADGSLDYLLTDFTLQGGTVKAWIGEPTDEAFDWALIYEATIDRVEATRKEIRIGITTIADQLKRPFQLRKYTGGGGLSGDSNVAGRFKPVGYGEIWGGDPVLISAVDWIYQVHDGSIQEIEWVREGGLDYTFTSDYGSFGELQGATLALGEYATCLSRGLFRIGVAPEGLTYPIRVGFKGDNSGNGYVSATGDILYRVARDRAFLPALQLDINSFNALPRGRVGYYANGSQELTIEQVYDRLLGGVVATYGVGRSAKISIQRLLPATSQLNDINIRGEQLLDARVEARPFNPRIQQPYLYAPTFAPVSETDISPLADDSVRARLLASGLTATVNQSSTAVIPATAQPTLVTYFAEQDSAQDVAEDALVFSGENVVPLRASLGRLGLVANLGSVMALSNARFAENYRGVIYEQEDNLGATITSRVVALG